MPAARGERTRRKIVEAARRVLIGSGALPLDAVATAAGVTRVTVYNQFGSKIRLLEALFLDSGARMRIDRAIAALALPDPRLALATLIDEQTRAWDRERKILRRLVGLAALDAEVGRVLASFESMRHRDARLLVARLAAEGALRQGVDPEEAAAIVLTLTGFELYDRLAAAGLDRAGVARALKR